MTQTSTPATAKTVTAATGQIARAIVGLVAEGYTVEEAARAIETTVTKMISDTNATPAATASALVATAVLYLDTIYGV